MQTSVHGCTQKYRATIVEAETYLFACVRYIELNPARAGMVKRPGEHTWSSYLYNAGLAADAMVKPHRFYRALGLTDEACSKAYQALIKVPIEWAFISSLTLYNAVLPKWRYGMSARTMMRDIARRVA